MIRPSPTPDPITAHVQSTYAGQPMAAALLEAPPRTLNKINEYSSEGEGMAQATLRRADAPTRSGITKGLEGGSF